ncbi:MAG: glutamine--fructose-6-phosphate transaminase (isomerizing) [Xanthomonadales bacterium]|uniref:glutamine--fructose-6-phosphate transaminase (isomerizing) n=3 Tax=Dokdonella sp. TaxID=2291710 RepID=UPI002B7A766A|nr:glutamine--fructose-6-phosphate transaminase (isomerizing) [Xanthomonadales bacterium]HQW76184.1 glutamine--fructose-6-phosphate transaminase (isomerizing) [Dokdonella sp.]MBK7012539.1 glutamine--fructose-6-phosphate transaminase (isomerizing) [Xanthomonadales bacterium]MBK7210656.1 glutamine--fructose-6-phosphate transaminase (isomerizing) [Xanthomonadales bacterium]MBL0223135.1 glutamine--fructose-6-phosphate transaminase (isomerizing) [Xanthomonadales bacterium]
MCGIVAATAERDVVAILMAGLHALEYRGYDSAGVAVFDGRQIQRTRAVGKVRELESRLAADPLSGTSGIAHTRWATHGVPNEANAHPHSSIDAISVVHNGIIENHVPLREELKALGYRFDSDTDTEVIAHLIHHLGQQGMDLRSAVRAAIARLHGAFAIAVLSRDEPGHVVGARRGSPLLVGIGIGENFLGSDVQALIKVTNQFIHLDEGDLVEITRKSIAIENAEGQAVERTVHTSELSADAVERGEYRHYMLKEIFEQPRAVADTLEGRIAGDHILPNIFGVDSDALLKRVRHVQIIACGTSYHAGMVARYWLEAIAGIPCSVEVASEYRYRKAVVPADSLFLAISQSGETADTLAALRESRRHGYLGSFAICNVPESSLVRESDLVLMTRAGPEIGVASTKAFTTQLTALALLVLELARMNGLDKARYAQLVNDLSSLPRHVADALEHAPALAELAEQFVQKNHALFLGRGANYPVALEGALKLKEISYIHAEGYPAGELKHGPLALVDEDMPVIAVAPNNELLEKLKSNLEEVRARGGELFVIADTRVEISNGDSRGAIIRIDSGNDFIAPAVFTIPLQLLAYHVAVLRGTDVDQPRNLAKSVTVE